MADQKSADPFSTITNDLIEKMHNDRINIYNRSAYLPGTRNLCNYIKEIGIYMKPNQCPETNFVDIGTKTPYELTEDKYMKLFTYLDECRKENTPTHWHERQYTSKIKKSGIMLDFDLVLSTDNIRIEKQHYAKLTKTLSTILIKMTNAKTFDFYYTIKKKPVQIEDGKYKYGIHILIPSIRVCKIFKKLYLQEVANSTSINKIFESLGCEGKDFLDMNSASVPVFLFGSCKTTSTPYILGNAINVQYDEDGDIIQTDIDTSNLNLVKELCLTAPKPECGYAPNIAEIVAEREQQITDVENVYNQELSDELQYILQDDYRAKDIYALLNILPAEYYEDRNKWRDCIYAISNTHPKYKVLAMWFSQKSKEKWDPIGFENMWNEALASTAPVKLTYRSIIYWAKMYNEDATKLILERSASGFLSTRAYRECGAISEVDIAELVHQILGNTFAYDSNGWYEFVTYEQKDLWKWRYENKDPIAIRTFLYKHVRSIFDENIKIIKQKMETITDDGEMKHCKRMLTELDRSKSKLLTNTFTTNVIKIASNFFYRRGFTETLDSDTNIFSCSNGIIILGEKCRFIDSFHEYPVSKYTPVAYKPFNPESNAAKVVINFIRGFFYETDVLNYMMHQFASCLSSKTRQSKANFFVDNGQSGKTALFRILCKVFGYRGDKFNIQLLSSEREDADKPNSALMKFKNINFAYCEESNRVQRLNTSRLKELVNAGEISGRDLNSKQETFSIHACLWIASQHSLIIEDNAHATWRRIDYYHPKFTYRNNPDPMNPYEKKEDPRYQNAYQDDPEVLSQMLGLLVLYYESFIRNYNGDLANLYSKTIRHETEEYRKSQDHIHRWITECIIYSPDSTEEYKYAELVGLYTEWYAANIDNKKQLPVEVIKNLKLSCIVKYVRCTPNNQEVLKHCRIIRHTEDYILNDGETTIQSNIYMTKEAERRDIVIDPVKFWELP